jgi:hypothetical protein
MLRRSRRFRARIRKSATSSLILSKSVIGILCIKADFLSQAAHRLVIFAFHLGADGPSLTFSRSCGIYGGRRDPSNTSTARWMHLSSVQTCQLTTLIFWIEVWSF